MPTFTLAVLTTEGTAGPGELIQVQIEAALGHDLWAAPVITV